MLIRRTSEVDAKEIADLVARTLREVNIKDYSNEYIEQNAEKHNEDIILERLQNSHMYVVCDGNKIIGCGAITGYCGSNTESILRTIFVLPEYQGQGVGKAIINALENDEYFFRATRIEIPSLITACNFYQKFGYTYKNNVTTPDNEGCIRLEKFNSASLG